MLGVRDGSRSTERAVASRHPQAHAIVFRLSRVYVIQCDRLHRQLVFLSSPPVAVSAYSYSRRPSYLRDSDGAILHIAQFWCSTPDSIEPLRKHGTAFHGSGHTTPWERVSDVIRCAGLRRDSQRLVDVVKAMLFRMRVLGQASGVG